MAGRIKIIKLRIRNGKVQRRKKVSNVKGYRLVSNKNNSTVRLKRISPTEKRNRKLGARRAKIKRRSERARINIKFHKSLRRRHNLGF